MTAYGRCDEWAIARLIFDMVKAAPAGLGISIRQVGLASLRPSTTVKPRRIVLAPGGRMPYIERDVSHECR